MTETITNVAFGIGTIIMSIGGLLVVSFLLLLLVGLVEAAWVIVSDNFRGICKAESLIHEYRKNREAFLKWRKDND